MLRALASTAITLAVLGAWSNAHADTNPDCQYANRLTGTCVITITPPGSGPGTEPISDPGAGGTAPSCLRFGTPVPCTNPDFGYWSNALECYLQRSNPQPPAGDPLWEGHYPAGAVYDCVDPVTGPYTGGGQFWLAGPPTGVITPGEAARSVVSRMTLRAAQIGIVPEDKPGRIGAVGAPVYMWTTPGPTTFGPQVLTATVGGVTITAVAKVDRIVWDMGDGTLVTCRTPGTVYRNSYGFNPSPDCGHRYTHTSARFPGGAYPITATSYWVVDWTGPSSSSGQIPLVLTSSTRIVVGELQALVTS
jgi:hypothetical protein